MVVMFSKEAERDDSMGVIVPNDVRFSDLLTCEKFEQKRMENRRKISRGLARLACSCHTVRNGTEVKQVLHFYSTVRYCHTVFG
jgi:hypothetical protein